MRVPYSIGDFENTRVSTSQSGSEIRKPGDGQIHGAEKPTARGNGLGFRV